MYHKTSNVLAFWRPTDPYAYLGQWYESKFLFNQQIMNELPHQITDLPLFKNKLQVVMKMLDNETYLNAEKFMMMGKASLFGDNIIFDQMSKTDSPKMQKDLGRKVANFDEVIWNTYSKDIVILGNYLKFNQNKQLKDQLLDTAGTTLVEGSPLDKIWGVGLKFDDVNITDLTKWKGTNYLGKCLMFVRDIL